MPIIFGTMICPTHGSKATRKSVFAFHMRSWKDDSPMALDTRHHVRHNRPSTYRSHDFIDRSASPINTHQAHDSSLIT